MKFHFKMHGINNNNNNKNNPRWTNYTLLQLILLLLLLLFVLISIQRKSNHWFTSAKVRFATQTCCFDGGLLLKRLTASYWRHTFSLEWAPYWSPVNVVFIKFTIEESSLTTRKNLARVFILTYNFLILYSSSYMIPCSYQLLFQKNIDESSL